MGNKVLVTGGAGFIGSWVVKVLEQRGFEPIVFDDFSTGEERNLEGLRSSDVIHGDILLEQDLQKVPFKECIACYHLAAKGDVQESIDLPFEIMRVNLEGTHRVLERCRQYQVPFLLASTCMVYGFSQSTGLPAKGISESYPTEPLSPYGASKLAAEQLCISYHHSYGMKVRVARPFNTYGPHQQPTNKEGGVIPVFLHLAMQGKPIQIFGDGAQTRDFLFVEDCARFLVDYLCADEAPLILNAGSGTKITIIDLANLILEEKGQISHVPHPHPQSEIHELLCDSTLAGQSLNWAPAIDLELGIHRNRTWLKEKL